MRRLIAAALLAALAASASVASETVKADALCAMIEDAAHAHGLPPAFMARLIWKESRFDAKALSPKGAQGVAQFMPDTARRRGLADPWDAAQAIPASTAYLAELRRRFGNLGLAAAAYNAGEARVERWLADEGGLPAETRAYVRAITFQPAEWFREPDREAASRPLDPALSFQDGCSSLPVMKTRALAGGKAWRVQLVGARSRKAALAAFKRLKARHPALAGETAVVRRSPMRGALAYAVQVERDSRADAAKLCARIRATGGACVVYRG